LPPFCASNSGSTRAISRALSWKISLASETSSPAMRLSTHRETPNSMRKMSATCSASVCLALLLTGNVQAKDPDATFRGNTAHTGVYDGAGAPAFHGVKWKFHTGAQILSSPTVSGDTVFIGSNDHFLHAVNLESGTEKWKFKTNGRVTSTPAVSNGLVFFLSYDSNFYALDTANGTLKWKFKTEGERRFIAKHLHGIEPATEPVPDPFDFYLSSPVVSGGLVFFGSGDTNVYALDAAT